METTASTISITANRLATHIATRLRQDDCRETNQEIDETEEDGEQNSDDDQQSTGDSDNDDCKSIFDCKTVFLGDLPVSLQGGDLTPLLHTLGDTIFKAVEGFKVIKGNLNFPSYAFIKFTNKTPAADALRLLRLLPPTSPFVGFRANFAKKNKALHVSNLDLSVKFDDLKRLFWEFGATSISAPRIDHTGTTSFSDIKFQSREMASLAKAKTNMTMFKGGKLIKLEWFRNGNYFHQTNHHTDTSTTTSNQSIAPSSTTATATAVLPTTEMGRNISNPAHGRSSTSNSSISSELMNQGIVDKENTVIGCQSNACPTSEGICPVPASHSTATGSNDDASPSVCPTNKVSTNGEAGCTLANSNTNTNNDGTREELQEGNLASQHVFAMSPVISIYVQFETISSTARVTEAAIRSVFEPFGNVVGCFIKSNYLSNNGKRQYGYAFIHYESTNNGHDSAKKAVETIGNGSPDNENGDGTYVKGGVAYRCEVSKNYRRATALLNSFQNTNHDSMDNYNLGDNSNRRHRSTPRRYRTAYPHGGYNDVLVDDGARGNSYGHGYSTMEMNPEEYDHMQSCRDGNRYSADDFDGQSEDYASSYPRYYYPGFYPVPVYPHHMLLAEGGVDSPADTSHSLSMPQSQLASNFCWSNFEYNACGYPLPNAYTLHQHQQYQHPHIVTPTSTLAPANAMYFTNGMLVNYPQAVNVSNLNQQQAGADTSNTTSAATAATASSAPSSQNQAQMSDKSSSNNPYCAGLPAGNGVGVMHYSPIPSIPPYWNALYYQQQVQQHMQQHYLPQQPKFSPVSHLPMMFVAAANSGVSPSKANHQENNQDNSCQMNQKPYVSDDNSGMVCPPPSPMMSMMSPQHGDPGQYAAYPAMHGMPYWHQGYDPTSQSQISPSPQGTTKMETRTGNFQPSSQMQSQTHCMPHSQNPHIAQFPSPHTNYPNPQSNQMSGNAYPTHSPYTHPPGQYSPGAGQVHGHGSHSSQGIPPPATMHPAMSSNYGAYIPKVYPTYASAVAAQMRCDEAVGGK